MIILLVAEISVLCVATRAASSYPPMCQLASGIPLRPLQLYRARRPVEARDGQHIALVELREDAAQNSRTLKFTTHGFEDE